MQKISRFRSKTYLSWVRAQPCAVCGGKADSAHHLIGIWNLSGMGLKAPDSMTIPVCDGPGGCHARIHSEAHLRWQQPIFLIETILAGLEAFPEGAIHDALQEAREITREKGYENFSRLRV